MIGIRHDRSLFDFFERTIRPSVCDISFDRIRKKEHILHRHADIVTQVIKIHVADIHTIHKHFTGSRIIKPAEQIP